MTKKQLENRIVTLEIENARFDVWQHSELLHLDGEIHKSIVLSLTEIKDKLSALEKHLGIKYVEEKSEFKGYKKVK